MTEKVVIPTADQIEVTPRHHTSKRPGDYLPFEPCERMAPEMAHAGEGYRFHITGVTHDERGFLAVNAQAQDKLVRRLCDKIRSAAGDLTMTEDEHLDDADVVVVSYGITSRIAERAIRMARARGIKAAKLRLITIWPFPEEKIRQIAPRVKAVVVPELNLGQLVFEVERVVGGRARTIPVTHAGGSVHSPEDILAAILEGAR